MNIPFLSFSGMHDPLKTELSKDEENMYKLYSTHGGEKKPYNK